VLRPLLPSRFTIGIAAGVVLAASGLLSCSKTSCVKPTDCPADQVCYQGECWEGSVLGAPCGIDDDCGGTGGQAKTGRAFYCVAGKCQPPNALDATVVVVVDSGPAADSGPPVPVAPTAVANGDQGAVVGNVVTLDGTASTDSNGEPLSYSWQLVAKPQTSRVVIANAVAARTYFIPDVVGSYLVALTVNDGVLSSQPSQLSITVVASEPSSDGGTFDGRVGGEGPVGGDADAGVGDAAQGDVGFPDTGILPGPQSFDPTAMYILGGLVYGAFGDWVIGPLSNLHAISAGFLGPQALSSARIGPDGSLVYLSLVDGSLYRWAYDGTPSLSGTGNGWSYPANPVANDTKLSSMGCLVSYYLIRLDGTVLYNCYDPQNRQVQYKDPAGQSYNYCFGPNVGNALVAISDDGVALCSSVISQGGEPASDTMLQNGNSVVTVTVTPTVSCPSNPCEYRRIAVRKKPGGGFWAVYRYPGTTRYTRYTITSSGAYNADGTYAQFPSDFQLIDPDAPSSQAWIDHDGALYLKGTLPGATYQQSMGRVDFMSAVIVDDWSTHPLIKMSGVDSFLVTGP
jgi:hypothetical protein